MGTIEGGYQADPELRARIQAFSPDEPGVVFPFSARLAKENGWSREHAQRVTREYLRFVYLAMTAGHPVTPSLAVDEAWHLHLTYTRSYWEEMCGRVLGRPLHHEPTRGGAAEEAKFADWYARTLASYRAAFDEEPPADIWPRPMVEDAAPPAASGGAARKRPGPALFGAALVAAVLVGACAHLEAADLFLGAVTLVVAGLFLMYARQERRRMSRRPRPRKWLVVGGGDGGGGCSDSGGPHHHSGGHLGHDSGGSHHDAGGDHGGCGGHSGCGHGGCHGGCGGGGCGSH